MQIFKSWEVGRVSKRDRAVCLIRSEECGDTEQTKKSLQEGEVSNV